MTRPSTSSPWARPTSPGDGRPEAADRRQAVEICPRGRFLRRRAAARQREREVYRAPAPARRFLPERIDRIWNRQIDPGRVFVLTLPLGRVADGYRASE